MATYGTPTQLKVAEPGQAHSSMMVCPGESVLIGRDPTAQVRIADTRSSRRHLMVEREAAGWPVRDLGTTNGTHLLDAGGRDRELRGDAIRKGFVAQLGSGDCVKLLTFDSTTSEGSGWLKATDPNLSATINKVTWKSAMTELLAGGIGPLAIGGFVIASRRRGARASGRRAA